MNKNVTQIARLIVQMVIFSSLALLVSCGEDIPEVRDPCDFVRSINEVSLDTSTSTCGDCFFKFSFRGRIYDFRDDRIKTWYECEAGRCTKNAVNDFFEFRLKSLQRSSDLFSSLNEQRALLTPDSLMQTNFNFFQQSFLLKDRCGVDYQVTGNSNLFSPDISSSIITSIKVWSFLIINDGVNPPRYVTDYIVSGTFSTQIVIDDKPESIGGSFTLLFDIVEPL